MKIDSTGGLAEGLLNGTFDRGDTQTRQVWWNGICGLEIRRDLIPLARNGMGEPLKLRAWGSFPNAPAASGGQRWPVAAIPAAALADV